MGRPRRPGPQLADRPDRRATGASQGSWTDVTGRAGADVGTVGGEDMEDMAFGIGFRKFDLGT